MLRSSGTVGKYIGGYHVTLELASSSSSRVFLGESVSPDRRNVAIKRFYAIHIASRQEQEDFLQEASQLKQFNHPYMLLMLSADVVKGTPYVVSEYAPDGSLYDLLQRQASKPMAQDDAITILSQVGQALHYAHQKNRIHGNLKPQNVLFNDKGNALLADFKFTSLSSLMSSIPATSPAMLAYMSSEQLEGITSKENDQYSLGCMAYEMFTGRKPFTTPSLKIPGTFYKTRTLIAPRKLNPALPVHIEQAILKAMAKDPSKRHTSVLEFIKVLGNPGILTVPETPPERSTSLKNTPPLPATPIANIPTLVQQQNGEGRPLLSGLKVAPTGATTLGQFNARAALWRNTFTSLTNLAALPLPKWAAKSPLLTSRKHKVRRIFLIAASILLIMAITTGIIFAFSPARFPQDKQATTKTGGTSPATHPPANGTGKGITVSAQPTQPTQKRTTTPLVKKTSPVVVHTPQPTLVPTQPPPPSNTLSVAPASLNATNCSSNGNGSYLCSVVLSLGSAAAGSQNWYTYSIGVGTNFKPSNGTITPGQNITIKITVFDNCTKPGTFVFVGPKTNVTSNWNC